MPVDCKKDCRACLEITVKQLWDFAHLPGSAEYLSTLTGFDFVLLMEWRKIILSHLPNCIRLYETVKVSIRPVSLLYSRHTNECALLIKESVHHKTEFISCSLANSLQLCFSIWFQQEFKRGGLLKMCLWKSNTTLLQLWTISAALLKSVVIFLVGYHGEISWFFRTWGTKKTHSEPFSLRIWLL